jgi:hypothetical protein
MKRSARIQLHSRSTNPVSIENAFAMSGLERDQQILCIDGLLDGIVLAAAQSANAIERKTW